MTREQCLNKALDVLDDRDTQHGRAEDNFDLCAQLWKESFNTNFKTEDIPLAMILLKMSRILSKEHANTDDYVDICGYSALACEIATDNPVKAKDGGKDWYTFSQAKEKLYKQLNEYYRRDEGIDFYSYERARHYAKDLLKERYDKWCDEGGYLLSTVYTNVYNATIEKYPYKTYPKYKDSETYLNQYTAFDQLKFLMKNKYPYLESENPDIYSEILERGKARITGGLNADGLISRTKVFDIWEGYIKILVEWNVKLKLEEDDSDE